MLVYAGHLHMQLQFPSQTVATRDSYCGSDSSYGAATLVFTTPNVSGVAAVHLLILRILLLRFLGGAVDHKGNFWSLGKGTRRDH